MLTSVVIPGLVADVFQQAADGRVGLVVDLVRYVEPGGTAGGLSCAQR
ncbi:MAG: hypothetical protein ACRDFS_04180 [Chloroflexota bacterium]